jgi:cell wall-associated NlpC family hydrolase
MRSIVQPPRTIHLTLALCLAVIGLFGAGCQSQVARPPGTSLPSREPAPATPALPAIAFTIQVGAFSTTERAAAYADLLASYGLDTYYFIDADGLCKVRFERFDTKAEARQRARGLQARGLIEAFYIVQPGPASRDLAAREARQENLVATARRFIGTPYRWGGASARRGFDCSGLTMTVYRLNGLELPRNSRSQYRSGRSVEKDALQKGDLVFFATGRRERVSHVGIYSGGGQFIHAPGKGKSIRTATLSDGYFERRYVGARRYL